MKRPLRIVLIILVVLLVPIAFFLVWTYINYAKDDNPNKTFITPYGNVSSISVSSVSDVESKLILGLRFTNHMPLSFSGSNFRYKLFVDSVNIVDSKYLNAITLPGSDSMEVLLPMIVKTRDYNSVVEKNDKQKIDSVVYGVQITFSANGLFKKQYDFEFSKKLPIYHIPKLNIETFQIESLNLSEAKGHFIVSINNTNKFSLDSKKNNYNLIIEGSEIMEGAIPNSLTLKAESITVLKIPVTISFKNSGKKLYRILKSGNNIHYKFNLYSIIESDNEFIAECKINYDRKGSIKPNFLPNRINIFKKKKG